MRDTLLRAILTGVIFGVLSLLKEKLAQGRLPRWADAGLFSVLLGSAMVGGQWIGIALGLRPSKLDPTETLAGCLGAGVLVGFISWAVNYRRPEKKSAM